MKGSTILSCSVVWFSIAVIEFWGFTSTCIFAHLITTQFTFYTRNNININNKRTRIELFPLLRWLSESSRLIGSASLCLVQLLTWLHVSTNIIFRTLKNGSLQTNSFKALNNNISYMYRNVIQNGVNSLSKKFVNAWFLSKSWKCSCNLDHTILFKLHHSMWYNHFLKECMERLQTSNVSISKVAQKSLKGDIDSGWLNIESWYHWKAYDLQKCIMINWKRRNI